MRASALLSRPALLAAACLWASAAHAYSSAEAAQYMRAQDWNGLAAYATQWTRAQPADPDGWAFLGMDYGLHLHQPAAAAEAISHSLQLNPNQADGWEALGAAEMDLGRYADARQALQRALQMSPNQFNFYNNLAAADDALGDKPAAMQVLGEEDPLAQRLDNAQVWYVMGNAYLKLEDAPHSVAAYQRCLRLNPNFAAGWTNLGVMLLWGGNPQGALQAYDRGAQLGDPLARQNAFQIRQAIAQQQQAAANSHQYDVTNHAYRVYAEAQIRRAQAMVGREP